MKSQRAANQPLRLKYSPPFAVRKQLECSLDKLKFERTRLPVKMGSGPTDYPER